MTGSFATPSIDLGLQRPAWISLHQALLLLSGPWTPIPESVFRSVESFPSPDNLDVKRRLILELATGRLLHKGELWHVRARSTGCPAQDGTIIAREYVVPSDFWDADKVCFGKSELRLGEPPSEFSQDRVAGDFFKLARIVVPTGGVENLRAPRLAKSTGGRPMKEGVLKVSAQVSAHIHHAGEMNQAALISAAQEYSETQLPEKERLGKTTITNIVREHLRAIAEYHN